MDKMWHDMFFLAVPIAEKVIRPVLVYIFLLVGLRLAGTSDEVRQLAQQHIELDGAADLGDRFDPRTP